MMFGGDFAIGDLLEKCFLSHLASCLIMIGQLVNEVDFDFPVIG